MVQRLVFIYSVLVASAVLALGAGAAFIAQRYLSEYELAVPTMGLALLTLIAAGLSLRLPRSPGGGRAVVWLSMLLLLAVLPPLSTCCPGGVTHARFGLTVVGAMPLPLVDPVLLPDGQLRFRDKTHSLLPTEIEPLRAAGAEIIVIGTGFSEQLRVPDEVREAPDVEVHDTPAAIRRYRELREEDVGVALLMHSTC
jgi:hypothetical protein